LIIGDYRAIIIDFNRRIGMKYRVVKVDDNNFIPQYKSWWSFGWRNFYVDYGFGNRNAISFFTEAYAIEYCQKKIKIKEPEKVVWESSTYYSNGFGPE
jgi:hypothetical protein